MKNAARMKPIALLMKTSDTMKHRQQSQAIKPRYEQTYQWRSQFDSISQCMATMHQANHIQQLATIQKRHEWSLTAESLQPFARQNKQAPSILHLFMLGLLHVCTASAVFAALSAGLGGRLSSSWFGVLEVSFTADGTARSTS